jgi:hypothetical protein
MSKDWVDPSCCDNTEKEVSSDTCALGNGAGDDGTTGDGKSELQVQQARSVVEEWVLAGEIGQIGRRMNVNHHEIE